MNNLNLRLQAGTDIPLPWLGASIHQPTIKEIAFVGEENFFMGCEILTFSKLKLSFEEQQRLQSYSDFDILMAILSNKEVSQDTLHAHLLLQLIFPGMEVNFKYNCIELTSGEDKVEVNNQNFVQFKFILDSMFCLSKNQKQEYRAGNAKAQELIDKFNKSKQKIAKDRGEDQSLDILGRYVSILAVGEHKDMNSLINYTVYQLFDEFDRFRLKQGYDIYLSAKMSFGGSDMEEPDNWMDSLRKSKKDELIS